MECITKKIVRELRLVSFMFFFFFFFLPLHYVQCDFCCYGMHHKFFFSNHLRVSKSENKNLKTLGLIKVKIRTKKSH